MRKIFIFKLCVIFSLKVHSQYQTFPESDAVWSVYTEKYFIEGDSIVNGIEYKKYFLTNDSVVASGTFYVLLRDDVMQQKIFILAEGESNEKLLYDFSLGVDETTYVHPISFPEFSDSVQIKVDQIDSILIGITYHKRLKISGVNENTNMSEYWIEGIGSTLGIFNAGMTGKVILHQVYPQLLCFEKSGELLYSNPFFNSCYEDPLSGNTNALISTKTHVYPNPTSGLITFYAEEEILFYSVFSTNGMMLKSEKIQNFTAEIDMSSFSPGIYFLQLSVLNGFQIIRLFVEN